MKWRDKYRFKKYTLYGFWMVLICLGVLYIWPRHKLHIYWINMDNAVERRHDMIKHLESVPFPQTRVSATDSAMLKSQWGHIQHEGVTAYDPAPDIDTWTEHVLHQKYTFVEFAIVHSHLRTIQEAWNDGCEYALILEDDARIADNFQREWYSYIQKAPDDWHMINLYTTNAQAIIHLNKIKDPFIHWKAWYWGVSAYILNRKGMDYILKRSIRDENFLFNDRIVVADEYVASMAKYTYQATEPYIFISGALSTHQTSEKFLLDPEYGNKINKLLKNNLRKEVYTDTTTNVLIITYLESLEELEMLKKEIRYITKRHKGNIEWAVHHSHLDLPAQAFHFKHVQTLFSKGEWDFVVFKHPGLTLNGFAWRTFLEFSNCATIVGAMPVHVDHFNLRTWVKHANEKPFDVFKLRHWAQGNKLDKDHGHGAYGELKSIPFDVVPRTFALVNGSFFKWYTRQQYPPSSYAWCGAANEFDSSKKPCAMVPLGVPQVAEKIPTPRMERSPSKLHEKWTRYSKSFVTRDKKSFFFKNNMVNKVVPFEFDKNIHENAKKTPSNDSVYP